jgi:hypothetical protein
MAFKEEILIGSKADTRGFKKAESAAAKLSKQLKNLGAVVGVSLGTAAIVNFGKASVKAFTEDQKSAVRLSTAVKNLGLAYEQANVDEFISNLERSASIADDVLRPAFQSLLTTTGSVTEAQKILKTAIDASRGSGYDLATVTSDLSKAYVGNTKSLQKYYLGLSKTQLAAMSFEEIQAKLNKQFTGASSAYLATYAGKMDALTTAAGNAQEVIGGALVDALIAMSGAGDVQGVVDKIDGISTASANAILRLGELSQALYFSTFKLDLAEFLGFSTAGVDRFEKLIEEQRRRAQYATASAFDPMNNALTGYKKDEKAARDAKKAAELQAKLLKQSLDNQKKLTLEQKKQTSLKKSGTVFDMEQIQLIAALKGKLSAEERLRVEAQLALLNDNDVLAQRLTKQILMAQDATGGLYQYFLTVGDAKIKNPFAFLDDWIIEFQKKLNALSIPDFETGKNGALTGLPIGSSGGIGTTSISPSVSSNAAIQSTFNKVLQDSLAAGNNYTQSAILGLSSARYEAAAQSYGMGGTQVIELKITGGDDVSKAIASNLQQQSLSTGNVTYINRRTGGFE